MQEIGLFEAKNKLSELVALAEKGESMVITKHGQPVARLVPMSAHVHVYDPEKARKMVEEMKRLRKGVTLGGLKVKDLQNEGRP